MQQVTCTTSVDFPKLGWGINAGETRDLPEDAEAQKHILAHPDIVEVKTIDDEKLTEDVKPKKAKTEGQL